MSCGLDASSCHVSTRAVRLSFVSTIHCWMAADLSLTERVLWSQFADLLITLDYVRPTTQWRIQRGGQGAMPPPPRSYPRPNFAVEKVCRIQGWKNAILKIPTGPVAPTSLNLSRDLQVRTTESSGLAVFTSGHFE